MPAKSKAKNNGDREQSRSKMANMTREEYTARAEEDDSWAPGWCAIDECLKPLYGDQDPVHLGSPLEKRAVLGGDQYIDGFSIYASPKGYCHGVTYGMSELYVDLESFGGELSGWGYELTIKYWTPAGVSELDMYSWSGQFFASLGTWVNKNRKLLESMHSLGFGGGKSINHHCKDSAITAALLVNDTVLAGTDTVHGWVGFLQVVGITQREYEVIRGDRGKAAVLVENMKADNPDLVVDFSRVKNYI